MLTVPLLSGALVAGWQWYQLPLAIVALAGYLAFNAATYWVKLPPARRYQTRVPLAVYAAVAAVAGGLVLLVAGWPITGWLALLAVPLTVVLVLTARKRERSVLSGLVTTFTASTIAVVAAVPDPWLWLQAPDWRITAIALINFGFFGGTVWSVKSMIRERGSNKFLGASVTWHAAWTITAAVAAALGALTWYWCGFFALITVRAAVLPLYGRRHRVTPLQIGLTEITHSVLLLVGAAFWH